MTFAEENASMKSLVALGVQKHVEHALLDTPQWGLVPFMGRSHGRQVSVRSRTNPSYS
jgi:hypothetical protein